MQFEIRPFKTLVVLLVLLIASGTAQAGGGFFDLMFNDETADLWGGFKLGGRKDDDSSGILLGARYLYSDEDEVDASVPAALLLFSGTPDANESIRYKAGIQWYLGEAADQDVEGVGVGGSVTWAPESFKGGFVGGRLFVTPGVFAFGDTDGILDWAVEGGYKINPKLRVFLQYAKMTVDIDGGGDVDANDGALLGVGLGF